ncbi:ubiquitin-specific protease [Danaus plexippus plexippus]|uniref:ubiquitinyl hydrolase 1 n=1 Tax=Danaus plexippus plexippus TaxID=278856 RepID=A0A212FEL7_DANPL|nr:ubiquitin carboxyl-terminal hydrolase 30 homolog [Danaus plexippus plexippus]OWR52160.1 ubiquitin-specific protease [Danaus plexippus plexippus]
MDGGDRILVAAGLTAAVVVGAFVLWGPGGAPKVRKRRGQIAGLQNLGRTCFLNTLLQALAACPTFIDWLKKYAKADGHNSMITTLYTVIEVVNGTHESARGTPVCPLGVLQSLRAAGWVVPADQQDAHELLHVLLSCIEEETTAMSKKPGCLSDALGLGGGRAWSALASPASPPAAPLSLRDDGAPPRPARPASAAPGGEPDLQDPDPCDPPARLCKGVSRSFCHLSSVGRRWAAAPISCYVCMFQSPVRYDKFDSISLSMANASTGLTGGFSLSGLLRAFTAPEMVSGVRCDKCCPGGEERGAVSPATQHAYTKHIRTVGFGKLPPCLVLQVARVEWRCGAPAKRADHVAFPETLPMAPYTTAPKPQPELSSLMSEGRLRGGLSVLNATSPPADDRALYRLCAVVVHVGGPRSGHFATYRRGNGFESKRWWYTSDTLVHEVSLAEVLRCSAYMLFYERLAPPPPPLTTHF